MATATAAAVATETAAEENDMAIYRRNL